MRILIDMQGAQTGSKHRGIGRYSVALAEAMLRNPRGHEFWIAVNDDMARDGLGALRELLPPERIVSFRTVQPAYWRSPANAWRRVASERMREAFLQDIKPDFVHVSSLIEGAEDAAVTSIGLRDGGPPTAATLYDLIPLHEPAYLDADGARGWYESKIGYLRNADLLLAISEYARRDAIDMLGIASERVVNISAAVSEIFRPVPVTGELRCRLSKFYGITGKYLMFSGGVESRKNLKNLLAAYARLPRSMREQYQLVVPGKLSQLERARLSMDIRHHGLADDRVVLVGYISDDVLVDLYCAAELFVFPSLHEGFGLPALEAMSCGTAVLGSSATSVPEVVGREDALFDPTDIGSISSSIQRALSDSDFADDLRAYGPRQAAKFSWERSASLAVDAFESRHEAQTGQRLWAASVASVESNRSALIAELGAAASSGELISKQDMSSAASAIAANEEVALDVLRREGTLPDAMSWSIEGPFDTSYSLALVNRELALALEALGLRVSLHSTDGGGDFDPASDFLRNRPEVAALHGNSGACSAADVTSRLLYPPRVSDMASRFNYLHAYAWEESGLPSTWVDAFTDHLQGISALSGHVGKLLVDNGVGLPVAVCGAGTDHWDRIEARPGVTFDAKAFRFLHVSSCLPRKGVDVLLRAYGDAFSSADDVSLVIKTFANPLNDVRRWLADAMAARADFPHVVIIEGDLCEAELKWLYAQCHVMVAPSRAEGFGLPMAEAMLSGLGVITTAWGGQCDFCTAETSWLIDYRLEASDSFFDVPYSMWAEPSRSHLASLLQSVRGMSDQERSAVVRRGQLLLRDRFSWEHVARRVVAHAQDVHALPHPGGLPVVAWIGPWKKGCDVSAHAIGLLDGLEARVFVLAERCVGPAERVGMVEHIWDAQDQESLVLLAARVDAVSADIVVVQYAPGLMAPDQLSLLLQEQSEAGRVVVVLLHDVDHVVDHESELLAILSRCDRLVVPSIAAVNLLLAKGVFANVMVLPLGLNLDRAEPRQAGSTTAIAAIVSGRDGLAQLGSLLGAVRELRKQCIDLVLKVAVRTPGANDAVRALLPLDEGWLLLVDEGELVSQAAEFVVLMDDGMAVDGLPWAARSALASGGTVLSLGGEGVWPCPVVAAPHAVEGLVRLIKQQQQKELQPDDAGRSSRWIEAITYSALGDKLGGMFKALLWARAASRRHSDPPNWVGAPGRGMADARGMLA